ncbi:hypothetical protein D3C71_1645400 [compost metagenome]
MGAGICLACRHAAVLRQGMVGYTQSGGALQPMAGAQHDRCRGAGCARAGRIFPCARGAVDHGGGLVLCIVGGGLGHADGFGAAYPGRLGLCASRTPAGGRMAGAGAYRHGACRWGWHHRACQPNPTGMAGGQDPDRPALDSGPDPCIAQPGPGMDGAAACG